MKHPIYLRSLAHAWKFTLHHRILWPLGIFSALLGGVGMVDHLVRLVFSGLHFQPEPTIIRFLSAISSVSSTTLVLPYTGLGIMMYTIVALMLFAIILVLFLISVIAQGTIIVEASEDTSSPLKTLDRSWHTSAQHVYKLASVHLLRIVAHGLLAYAIFYAVINASFLVARQDTVLFFLIFFVAMLLSVFFSMLSLFSSMYILLYNYAIIPAVRSAWRLIRSHLIVVFEVGILLFSLQVVASLAFLLLAVLLILPLGIIWIGSLLFAGGAFVLVASALTVLCLITYVTLVGAWISLFSVATYTYLFRHMDGTGIVSRALHFVTGGR